MFDEFPPQNWTYSLSMFQVHDTVYLRIKLLTFYSRARSKCAFHGFASLPGTVVPNGVLFRSIPTSTFSYTSCDFAMFSLWRYCSRCHDIWSGIENHKSETDMQKIDKYIQIQGDAPWLHTCSLCGRGSHPQKKIQREKPNINQGVPKGGKKAKQCKNKQWAFCCECNIDVLRCGDQSKWRQKVMSKQHFSICASCAHLGQSHFNL